jgi:hypothetical protein
VHIAKTGGTSVRAALQGRRWRDPWYWPMFLCSRLSHLSGHRIGTKLPRHAKVVAAKELLPKEWFDGCSSSPSCATPGTCRSAPSTTSAGSGRSTSADTMTSAFLRWKLDPERPYQYHVDTSIELQTDYLIDLRGEIVVDFIGRYERLHDDFEQACGASACRRGAPAPAPGKGPRTRLPRLLRRRHRRAGGEALRPRHRPARLRLRPTRPLSVGPRVEPPARMDWFLLSLLCAFSLASADAATKAWLRTTRPRRSASCAFPHRPHADAAAGIGMPAPWTLPAPFWGWMAVMVPLEIAAMLLYMAAIRDHPLSLTVPYLAFTPVFVLLIADWLLGERVSPQGTPVCCWWSPAPGC